VRAGLSAVALGVQRILCHDAARPLASSRLFERALEALQGWDGVVPVLRVVDTVKRVHDGRVEGTEPRDALALAQTPQVFRAAALRDAHGARLPTGSRDPTTAPARACGYRVRAIEGERTNLKITTPDDIRLAEALAR
jgi:4-diphosphocytidyl-2-methyl-D-erithritol synthase